MVGTGPADSDVHLGYSNGLGSVSEIDQQATSVVWKEEPAVATWLKPEKVLVGKYPTCTRSVSKEEEETNDVLGYEYRVAHEFARNALPPVAAQ